MPNIKPNLGGVPETMLWTLHNRVSEAIRPDGILFDPEAIRIYEELDYDFVQRFGRADGSHALRAIVCDRLLRDWLRDHPDGLVISLGEGLETQSRRVDNGRMRWLTVDLPEAIAIRERFLPQTDRFRHVASSALDLSWMDAAEAASDGVFVVVQGLLMYFQPDEVRGLVSAIVERFSRGEMFFDVLPRFFSSGLARFGRTRRYTVPEMPWGLDADQIEDELRTWHPAITRVKLVPFEFLRGFLRYAMLAMRAVPPLRSKTPSFVHLSFGGAVSSS
jgi:O-methyltransferase involved in polyketide biosynthesis